jgi:hypothetical protein
MHILDCSCFPEFTCALFKRPKGVVIDKYVKALVGREGIRTLANPIYSTFHRYFPHSGEVLEIGALLAIRSQDVGGFERYMTQLKTFYREYREFMPESPRMFMLLGML